MTAAMHRVLDTIEKLDLNANVTELETKGYTTIKAVLSETQIKRAQQAIVASAEKKMGKTVDLATGEGFRGWHYVPHMLYDDEVFEDILMEPQSLALVTYLLGESCLLSSIGCHFKAPGGEPLLLHSDNSNGKGSSSQSVQDSPAARGVTKRKLPSKVTERLRAAPSVGQTAIGSRAGSPVGTQDM